MTQEVTELELANIIRSNIESVVTLMNAAKARGLSVGFNINLDTDGKYVTKTTITKEI